MDKNLLKLKTALISFHWRMDNLKYIHTRTYYTEVTVTQTYSGWTLEGEILNPLKKPKPKLQNIYSKIYILFMKIYICMYFIYVILLHIAHMHCIF